MRLLKHVEYLWRNSQVKDAVIIKVVPRTDATTRPLTGRWVDTMMERSRPCGRRVGTSKLSTETKTSSPMMHLTMMLVEAALKGHDGGNRGLQRGLLPVTFEPAELSPDYIWEAVSAFPGLGGPPRALDARGANVLTSSMGMEQAPYDAAWSIVLIHVENTSRK